MKSTKKLLTLMVLTVVEIYMPVIAGLAPNIGQMLQPMHIPVLLAAYFVGGPMAMILGAVSPVLNYSIWGMPGLPNVIPMSAELAVYGIVASVGYEHSKKRGKSILKSLLVAMLAGRIVWGAVTYFVQHSMGNQFTFEMFVKQGVANAIPGIILQIMIVSIGVYQMKKHQNVI